MLKTIKIGALLLFGGVLLNTLVLSANEQHPAPASPLMGHLSNKILEVIEQTPESPAIKKQMALTWSSLMQKGVVEERGSDEEFRATFVGLQGLIENVFTSELNHSIVSLKAFIHTPMPPTPLCSKGEISKNLVNPTIETDPSRLRTVKARVETIRDLLHQGATLYCVYPKGGMEKRTEAQQSIYKEELANYPGNLIDYPLHCEALPSNLIGATYFFTDIEGHSYVFSIKMTQANDPKEKGQFGLWFGSLYQKEIGERVDQVLVFIKKHSS